jgi:hypothetical protein
MPIWKMEQGGKRDVEVGTGTVEFIKNQVVPHFIKYIRGSNGI